MQYLLMIYGNEAGMLAAPKEMVTQMSAAYGADCLTWISRLKLLKDSAAIPFGLKLDAASCSRSPWWSGPRKARPSAARLPHLTGLTRAKRILG